MTDLGNLISTLYVEFLEAFGDADLAAVATAVAVNERLAELEHGADEVVS